MMGEKKISKYRLFTILAIAFILGLLISSFVNLDFKRSYFILFFSIGALLLTGFYNLIYKNYSLSILSFAIIAIFVGAIYFLFFNFKSQVEFPYDEETKITGQIISKPEVDYKRQRVVLKAENVKFKDAKILVSLPHFPAYHYGDQLAFSSEIKKPGMIEDFDYAKYLKKDSIYGYVIEVKNIEKLDKDLNVYQKTVKFLYSISEKFENKLNKIFPEPHASLANGLLLGLRKNMPDDFKEALNTAGLTHIIALSGYNVTIIISILSIFLLRVFNVKYVFWVGLIFVAGFVILTGASPSIMRAAIFSMLLIFGRTIGRQGDLANILLLTALIMLVINPFSLRYDAGFQLSFVAFCGLVYLSPLIKKFFERKVLLKLPAVFKTPLIETLSAQIMVLPLILVIFGRVSLISPISNMLVLTLIPYTMGVVFIAGLFSFIFVPLGKVVAVVAWPFLQYIISMTFAFAKIPHASIEVEKNLWIVGLLMYGFIIYLIAFRNKRIEPSTI